MYPVIQFFSHKESFDLGWSMVTKIPLGSMSQMTLFTESPFSEEADTSYRFNWSVWEPSAQPSLMEWI